MPKRCWTAARVALRTGPAASSLFLNANPLLMPAVPSGGPSCRVHPTKTFARPPLQVAPALRVQHQGRARAGRRDAHDDPLGRGGDLVHPLPRRVRADVPRPPGRDAVRLRGSRLRPQEQARARDHGRPRRAQGLRRARRGAWPSARARSRRARPGWPGSRSASAAAGRGAATAVAPERGFAAVEPPARADLPVRLARRACADGPTLNVEADPPPRRAARPAPAQPRRGGGARASDHLSAVETSLRQVSDAAIASTDALRRSARDRAHLHPAGGRRNARAAARAARRARRRRAARSSRRRPPSTRPAFAPLAADAEERRGRSRTRLGCGPRPPPRHGRSSAISSRPAASATGSTPSTARPPCIAAWTSAPPTARRSAPRPAGA